MEWIVHPELSWAERLAIRVLQVGPLPEHIAVIMDGNRRYAKLLQKDTLEGHKDGFIKLTHVLSWCRHLGIKEVTAYAFSIENFKRPKAEVDGLMSLAEAKFQLLIKQKDKFEKYGVKINGIGNLQYLSPQLRKLAAEVIEITKDNREFTLNLAIAYTSREEICNAIKEIRIGVQNSTIIPAHIDEDLFNKCLYTSQSKNPPDLLIRTSGEVRLSDFLLWQTGYTHLFFTKALWPEISIWDVFGAIFHFQRYHHKVRLMKPLYSTCIEGTSLAEEQKKNLVNNIKIKRNELIRTMLDT